jgi:hypothetical protein
MRARRDEALCLLASATDDAAVKNEIKIGID